MSEVVVYKDRTNVLPVSLGIDVSADVITSEIRTQPDVGAPLIVTWVVTKPNGGSDGELLLTLDNSVVANLAENSGYMDLKRVVGGEPVPVFERPLEVKFQGSVTA